MAITLNRAELIKALRTVSVAAPRHTYKPILRNAKLSVSASNGAVLAATDLELAVSCRIGATDTQEPTDLLLPIADVSRVLANDSSEMVQFSPIDNGTLARTDQGSFRFLTEPPAAFPSTGDPETSWQCTFPAVAICGMLRRVAAACEARAPWSTDCVALRSPKETELVAIGTDTGLMIIQCLNAINAEGVWPKQDVLIPAETAAKLARMLPADSGETISTLSVGDDRGSLSTCDLRADFLLRQGCFPRKLPPMKFVEPSKFDIPVSVLRPAVQQIGVLARLGDGPDKYGITLKVTSGRLEISESRGSVVEVPVPEDVGSVSVRLSCDRLLTALQALDLSEVISVQLQSDDDPFTGLIFDTVDTYYHCLLMGLEPRSPGPGPLSDGT